MAPHAARPRSRSAPARAGTAADAPDRVRRAVVAALAAAVAGQAALLGTHLLRPVAGPAASPAPVPPPFRADVGRIRAAQLFGIGAAAEAGAPPGPAVTDLKLFAIVAAGDSPATAALVSPDGTRDHAEWRHVGAPLADVRVVAIEANAVTVERAGVRQVLRLFDGVAHWGGSVALVRVAQDAEPAAKSDAPSGRRQAALERIARLNERAAARAAQAVAEPVRGRGAHRVDPELEARRAQERARALAELADLNAPRR